MVAFRKTNRRKRNPLKKRRPARNKLGGKAFTKAVKKVMMRNVETKTFSVFRPINFLYNNSNATNWQNSIRPLSPFAGTGNIEIFNGIQQGQRIGNKITITRAVFRGSLNPLIYNNVSNTLPQPKIVKMFIFYDKANNTFESVPDSTFLQLGNGTAPLQGTTIDMMAKVNSDRWRVLTTRTFKLGYADYSGTGVPNGSQGFSNNDFKLNHRFSIDITKYLIKNVKFNDTDTSPTTRGLFMICQVVNADGSALASTQVTADMKYILDYEYKDA